jgi:restriction endonuclease S subunit
VKPIGRIDPYFHLPQFRHVQIALDHGLFPLVRLEDICFSPVGGATPLRADSSLYGDSDTGIPFLRIMNIKPNDIDMTDLKFVSPAVHNGELQRSQLAAGDILMTITGRVGTAAVVPADLTPANINQHIVRLRIKREDCLPEYLAAYLNTKIGLLLSNRCVTGGTRIALDYGAIRKLQVPLPKDDKTQQEIVDEVHRRRAESRKLRIQAEAEWNAAKAHFEAQLLDTPD